jgi:redox-sensitive bicupin YhaK (pirin superfamily)
VNPDRQRFGALLVLNEDVIQPGEGFGEHFHDNMEIVTIPLSGRLRHQDSLGNGSVIQAGDVQIMSAGTGIMHSEFNDSQADSVHLLQIWIIPNQRQLPTRYEEKRFSSELFHNRFFTVVSPDSSVDRLQIFQQTWF